MTQRLIARRARVFYGPFPEVWATLQSLYAKRKRVKPFRIRARRAFYRNSLLSVLGQIEAVPECRMPMFNSLLDYVQRARAFDGLESVFLTLLNAVNRRSDRETFERGIQTWTEFGAKPTVAGAGPGVFYNVATRRLSFFSRQKFASLRPGKENAVNLAFGRALARNLEHLQAFSLNDVFFPAGQPRPQPPPVTIEVLEGPGITQKTITDRRTMKVTPTAV